MKSFTSVPPVLLVIVTFQFSILGEGCAIHNSDQLPNYTYDEIRATQKNRLPIIEYKARYFRGSSAKIDRYSGLISQYFEKQIEKAFLDSNMFKGFTTTPTGKERLKLAFLLTRDEDETEEDLGLRNLHLYLTIFSLGIIPFHEENKYHLRASVSEGEKILKKYNYETSVDIWGHLLILPGFFFWDGLRDQAESAAIDQLLINFLHDLREDNLLLDTR